MGGNKNKIFQLVWFIVVMALLVFSFKMLRGGELETQVQSFGFLAPAVLVILKAATLIIAPLGGSPLYIIAGALFGFGKGLAYTFIGDVLGSLVCFWISRTFGQPVVKFFVSERYFDKVISAVSLLDRGKSFLKARIALITIPELLAYAAGLSRINFWTFILIHTAFYIPVDLVLVLVGDTVAEFSIKHLVFLYGAIMLMTALGFQALYKDYESREKFLRDKKIEKM